MSNELHWKSHEKPKPKNVMETWQLWSDALRKLQQDEGAHQCPTGAPLRPLTPAETMHPRSIRIPGPYFNAL